MLKSSENSASPMEAKECSGQQSESAKSSENNHNCNYEEVEETPFAIARTNQGYYVTTCGMALHKEPFQNKEDAKSYIESKCWNLLSAFVIALNIKMTNEMINNTLNNKKDVNN